MPAYGIGSGREGVRLSPGQAYPIGTGGFGIEVLVSADGCSEISASRKLTRHDGTHPFTWADDQALN